MSDNDPIIKTLHTTVLCYLSTLLAVGECLGDACPPVGGPYRTKLSRLKSRLAFDTSSASVEESSQIAAAELKDYAVKASAYLESYSEGHRRAIAPMEGMLRHLSQRLEFHGARLREVGGQSASERQSAAWHSCVESMSYDTLSLIARMREELNLATSLIAEAATTDTVTGLMNRREIERRIVEKREAGEHFTRLVFCLELAGDAAPIPPSVWDQVLRQAAGRLTQQFRHSDRVGRWTEREFLVLFAGPPKIAEMRVSQITPWIAGRYVLNNGDPVNVAVHHRVLDHEEAHALVG